MNLRSRERVSTQVFGTGTIPATGEPFSFQAEDFTTLGMRLIIDGCVPEVGNRLKLAFQIPDPNGQMVEAKVHAQVVRGAEVDGMAYGVRWIIGNNKKALELIENFYLERFFDGRA